MRRSGRPVPRRAAPRPASRGAVFPGPSSMEIPGNIQVCFASLETDAHIGFEAARLRPKGWAGDRGSAYPVSTRGNLLVFLVAFKADGGWGPLSPRVPLTRMAPDNAARRRSHSTSPRKRGEVMRA